MKYDAIKMDIIRYYLLPYTIVLKLNKKIDVAIQK